MIRLVLKVLITSFLVAGVSELGKRSAFFGAILVSLPITTILALSWLYFDTRDVEQVAQLSTWVFWALVPSFFFLLSLPWMLRHGVRFAIAMPVACGIMIVGYTAFAALVRGFGVKL